MITTTWRCKSLRLIGGKSPERLTPGDPATPRALDNEELLLLCCCVLSCQRARRRPQDPSSPSRRKEEKYGTGSTTVVPSTVTLAAIWYGQPGTHRQRPATSNIASEVGPTRAPTGNRQTPRTPLQSPPHTPPPPQAPWTRHNLPASMDSSAEAVPTSSAEVVSRFFEYGEKCEKPLHQLVQEDPRKTLRSPGLAENLDLHLDQETRRSAPKTLLNPVHGEKPCRSPATPGRGTGLSTICSAVTE